MAVQQSMTINASPETVFGYVADITKHPEWAQAGHKLQIEKTSEGPAAKGATFASVGHQFGENHDTVTITEYEPGKRVVYEADGNAGTLRHWFEVSPADGGTQLTKGLDVVKAKFPFALFVPIVTTFIAPGGLRGDLSRIKAKLEGS